MMRIKGLWIVYLLVVCVDLYAGYGGGAGTLSNPYQIKTIEHFNVLRNTTTDWKKCFILVSDLDFQGQDSNFEGTFASALLAPDTDNDMNGFQGLPFRGVLDGRGFVIRNVNIDTKGKGFDYLGLIGYLGPNGCIKNLGIEFSITGGDTSRFIGGLCGWNYQGKIEKCYTAGTITVGDQAVNVGGICGYNEYYGKIIKSYSLSHIQGGYVSSLMGGLCGVNDVNSSISQCYSSGSVTGEFNTGCLGGVCGENWGEIKQCYTISSVTGGSFSGALGGLCGQNTLGVINQCYAAGLLEGGIESEQLGGLCGSNWNGQINQCFWNNETTGMTTSAGGIGKSIKSMMDIITYMGAGWDFFGLEEDGDEADWKMLRPGEDYPRLAWQKAIPGDVAGQWGVDIADLMALQSSWLSTTADDCDLAPDGKIDLRDWAVLANNWLEN